MTKLSDDRWLLCLNSYNTSSGFRPSHHALFVSLQQSLGLLYGLGQSTHPVGRRGRRVTTHIARTRARGRSRLTALRRRAVRCLICKKLIGYSKPF